MSRRSDMDKATERTSVDLVHALKEACLTAAITFAVLLPLVGFETISDINNKLVLDTRWGLLFSIVAVVGVGRLLTALFLAPWQARRRMQAKTSAASSWLPAWLPSFGRWFGPFAVGFAIVYPFIAIGLTGFGGALKWVDNFGIQVLIYVMLGWGLNIVVGLA